MFILGHGSESLQLDNASIYLCSIVQFGVTFIMFFDMFLKKFYPSFEGFSVTI